jgi:hypothetical protein
VRQDAQALAAQALRPSAAAEAAVGAATAAAKAAVSSDPFADRAAELLEHGEPASFDEIQRSARESRCRPLPTPRASQSTEDDGSADGVADESGQEMPFVICLPLLVACTIIAFSSALSH